MSTSSDRTIYDKCSAASKEQENYSVFNRVTDLSVKSPPQCGYTFNGKAPGYSIPGSAIDIESDLRNQWSVLNRCDSKGPTYVFPYADQYEKGVSQCTEMKAVHSRVVRGCTVPNNANTRLEFNLLSRPDPNVHSNNYIGENSRLSFRDMHKRG